MPVLETIAAVGAIAAIASWLTEPGGPLAGVANPEEQAPPPGAPDPLCIGNDAALRKASDRQWTVLVRLARRYKNTGKTSFPQDWRCRAGTTSKGMEAVLEAWLDQLAAVGVLDPRVWEALLYANGQAMEAFGQKIKSKVQHEIDKLSEHFDPVTKAGKAIESGAKSVAKKAGIKL